MVFRVSAPDLRAVMRELRQASNGKELRKELRGRFYDVMRPIVPEVKAAYRANPSRKGKAGRRGGSLRGALARATHIEVLLTGRGAGARIRVDGRRMPDRMGRVPSYYEGSIARWKHPVFGDPDVSTWVVQRPVPTFYDAVKPHEAQARREAIKAVDAVFKRIARAR